MDDAVIVCDSHWVVRYTNPGFSRIYEYAPGELIGQSAIILSPSGEADSGRLEEIKRTVETGRNWRGHLPMRTRTGRQFTASISASGRLLDGELHCVAVHRDLSLIEAHQAALVASEQRFRTIFENAPVMIDSFDDSGRCVLWNRECERTLGYTFEEMQEVADPLALFYPDEVARSRVIESIQAADGVFREYRVRTKNGDMRSQMWADFRLPSGELISVGYDITDRQLVKDLQRANEELRRSRSELEDKHRRLLQSEKLASLGQMSAGVAHEINNPLMVVRGYAQQIRDLGGKLLAGDERIVKALDRIERNCVRMETIVARMRDYSRYSERDLLPLNLDETVRDISDLLAAQLKIHDIDIHLQLHADGALVIANTARIEQLIVNLVMNAKDAILAVPRQRGNVIVETSRRGSNVYLAVIDDGVGIAADVLPHIFDPFYTTKPPGSGIGLGLSIAHEIAHENAGEIEVDTAPGRGSTIRIRLPVADVPSP